VGLDPLYWRALILPLFLGFGLTLMIEAAAAKRLLKNMNIWKGVLLANVFSYLFLVLMLPFFPNPYNSYFTYRKLERMIEEGHEKTEILLVLYHLRASNLFLLGFTDNTAPYRRPYEPSWHERALIRDNRESNPEIAQAIEKDLETLKHWEAP
jgi:hypothetical protein